MSNSRVGCKKIEGYQEKETNPNWFVEGYQEKETEEWQIIEKHKQPFLKKDSNWFVEGYPEKTTKERVLSTSSPGRTFANSLLFFWVLPVTKSPSSSIWDVIEFLAARPELGFQDYEVEF